MADENNDANESGLSDEELAAQQADEAAANQGDDAGNDDGQPSGDDGQGEGEGGDGQDDGQPDPKPEKKELPKGVQKRIDKITRQKYDAERHIQDLQRQLDSRPEAQPTNTDKPTLAQFDHDDELFIEALTDWKVQQAVAAQQTKNAEVQRRSQQDQVVQNFETKRQTTLVKGVTAYDDFEEVAIENPDLHITPQMADIITDSDISHEIAYYLGSNTSEASEIAQLHPLRQAAAIARLEVKLTAKPAKKVSKTPDPIKPVGGKGHTSTEIDPTKDWKKWAEARNREESGR